MRIQEFILNRIIKEYVSIVRFEGSIHLKDETNYINIYSKLGVYYGLFIYTMQLLSYSPKRDQRRSNEN